MSSVEPKKSAARERILSKAGELFYREGYRAVGIDRVIAEAEVAKASFYKHFPSKDDLIVAWIDHAETISKQHMPEPSSQTPLFDYMDAMINIAQQNWCMGCTYQVSAAEFADAAHPAHAAAIGVKSRVLGDLKDRAAAQGLKDPDKIAEMMFLLLEGVWASVRMFKADAPLQHAKAAVWKLAGTD